MTLGNNIIMLCPENDHLRLYLYIWFKYLQGKAIIQLIKGGSAQPKFNKTDFKNTSVLLPPDELLSQFDDTVSPMFAYIEEKRSENQKLSYLRDSLLPKLISGELDVSVIDL
jgi:type I restriction enzyme S subunit